jgi:hypothetical protein
LAKSFYKKHLGRTNESISKYKTKQFKINVVNFNELFYINIYSD